MMYEETIKALGEDFSDKPKEISDEFLKELTEKENEELIKFLRSMSEKSKEKN